jgi:hypothetical protein
VTVQKSLGRGSRGDGADLPSAIAEVDLEAKAYMKQHYYALEWTEVLEEVSKNKEGAFESAVARKMKNVAIDMSKDMNRQWYNSVNGELAKITTDNAAGTSQVVDSVQFLQVGDCVDVVEADGTPIASGTGIFINAIDKATRAVTFSASIDPSGNELIVLHDNFGNEVEGLRHVANADRVLHDIDSTTYDAWDGTVLPASGAVAGESLLEQLYDRIGERGRGDIDTALATRGIRRRLADEFAGNRRALNEKALDVRAGYRMVDLTVGGSPVEMVIDDDCPKGHVFMTSKDTLKILQLTQPGFMESSESNGAYVTLKNSSTAGTKKAVWQTWYRYHATLACTDPARNGMIPDAEDDAVA